MPPIENFDVIKNEQVKYVLDQLPEDLVQTFVATIEDLEAKIEALETEIQKKSDELILLQTEGRSKYQTIESKYQIGPNSSEVERTSHDSEIAALEAKYRPKIETLQSEIESFKKLENKLENILAALESSVVQKDFELLEQSIADLNDTLKEYPPNVYEQYENLQKYLDQWKSPETVSKVESTQSPTLLSKSLQPKEQTETNNSTSKNANPSDVRQPVNIENSVFGKIVSGLDKLEEKAQGPAASPAANFEQRLQSQTKEILQKQEAARERQIKSQWDSSKVGFFKDMIFGSTNPADYSQMASQGLLAPNSVAAAIELNYLGKISESYIPKHLVEAIKRLDPKGEKVVDMRRQRVGFLANLISSKLEDKAQQNRLDRIDRLFAQGQKRRANVEIQDTIDREDFDSAPKSIFSSVGNFIQSTETYTRIYDKLEGVETSLSAKAINRIRKSNTDDAKSLIGKIREKRKQNRRKKSLMLQMARIATFPIRLAYERIKQVVEKIPVIARTIRGVTSLSEAISGRVSKLNNFVSSKINSVQTSVGNTWHRIKTNPITQMGIKTYEAYQSVKKGVTNVLSGLRTGAIASIPFLLAGSPIAAGVGFTVGTSIGTLRSWLRTSTMDLDIYTYKYKGGFFEDMKLRYLLNSSDDVFFKFHKIPTNLSLDLIQDLNTRRWMGQALDSAGDGIKQLNLSKLAQSNRLFSALDSFEPAMAGAAVGYLAGGPIGALAGALLTGGASYIYRRALFGLALKLKDLYPRFGRFLSEVPGLSMLDLFGGSSTVADQLNLLNPHLGGGVDKFLSDQVQNVLPSNAFGIYIPKGLTNILGTYGYFSAVGSMTKLASTLSINASAALASAPLAAQAAAFLPTLAYVLGSFVFGYQITMGGLIASAIVGTTSFAIASAVGASSWGIGAVPAYFASVAILSVPGYYIAKGIDWIVEQLGYGYNTMSKFFGILGLVGLAKALRDLVTQPIRNLADLAQLSISITLALMSVTVVEQLITLSTQAGPEIESSANSPTSKVDTNYNIYATQKIPALEIDCTKTKNGAVYSNTKFVINEIIVTQGVNGELMHHIKGQNSLQDVYISNLSDISNNIHEQTEVNPTQIIGACQGS